MDHQQKNDKTETKMYTKMDGMFNHLHVVILCPANKVATAIPSTFITTSSKKKKKMPQAESCEASMTTPTHLPAPGDKQANTYTLIHHHASVTSAKAQQFKFVKLRNQTKQSKHMLSVFH